MDWTRLVKHGLDSFSKTWTGLKLKSARLVKHGLKTGNYFKRAMWGGEGGVDIRSTYNKQSQINY